MSIQGEKYFTLVSELPKSIEAYLGICKLKVVFMLVLTAWVGIILAPDAGRTAVTQFFSLLGIGLVSAAAAAINHVVDQERDQKMARTRHRPLVQQQLTSFQASIFAACIGLSGVGLLLIFSNWLCAALTVSALFGYAVVYSVFLKHMTPQNIVIGGLAGAMPPLLGWVSESGVMSAEPWLLVMIIFTWTPPHFWALAIARKKDYERAHIPMLPVTHGVKFTKLCMLIYAALLMLVCLLPFLIGMSSWVYLIISSLLNVFFVQKIIYLYFESKSESAMQVFRFSITYLLLLFVVLFVDKLVL
ncbi:protoheme IX farnesyltransferase [Pseudoalteromonas luteoviolacea]|uniref:Protoheme IX farnesyltransferase n=1 Tax=Pseudoalteromonas luteoviolacea TaxID=43657 RepID=A0A1C0TLM1_9GAMM|nr:heme o synthase [Pseudoalteromonas luteoviolacea]MBQ4813774.1 heme o synthase [Pseudoalteromonas luteoviolacea]OCQ19627.1 protoheme IX farnesyltransferase [Pseudoalteromonas luteoviolacea]